MGMSHYNLIEMAMGAEVNGKLVHQKDSVSLPDTDAKSEGEEGKCRTSQKAGNREKQVTTLEVAAWVTEKKNLHSNQMHEMVHASI